MAAERFDLVILDLNLPQMDGLEVLRRMRTRRDPAAVMILTARGTPEERVRGLDLGRTTTWSNPSRSPNSRPASGRCCAVRRACARPRSRSAASCWT
ncbi:response regulator [Paracoccus marcusii]|uniref:response regulator n=1 Tax=Paracoccus marcusii TaxID=59779 RepID=UPI002ED3F759|nr:response regulator [Paracoccus marcusii]